MKEPVDRQHFINSQIAFSELTAKMLDDNRGDRSEGHLSAVILRTLATESVVHQLLLRQPSYRHPALLLMASVQYLVNCGADDELAKYYPRLSSANEVLLPEKSPDNGFRRSLKLFVEQHETELAVLMDRHIYQANPPSRVAQLSVGLAYVTRNWGREPIAHIDFGSATGIGTLLGRVEVTDSSDNIIVKACDSLARLRMPFHGALLPPRDLHLPNILERFALDLDPPNIYDEESMKWLRACAIAEKEFLESWNTAIALTKEHGTKVQKGNALELIPEIEATLPPNRPLAITDSYATVFLSDDQLAEFRRILEVIGNRRPLSWLSLHTPMPPAEGNHTLTGIQLESPLISEAQETLIGLLTSVTWHKGNHTNEILSIAHPFGFWMKWMGSDTPKSQNL